MQYDLSTSTSPRRYFSPERINRFNTAVDQLYDIAKQKTVGADYTLFIRRYLESNIKKNTCCRRYINKLIIITDGYIETNRGHQELGRFETEVGQSRAHNNKKEVLKKAVANGNVLEKLKSFGWQIPTAGVSLDYHLEVLVCELKERDWGIGYHHDILEFYWKDWFQRMGVEDIEVVAETYSRNSLGVVEKVKKFILKN